MNKKFYSREELERMEREQKVDVLNAEYWNRLTMQTEDPQTILDRLRTGKPVQAAKPPKMKKIKPIKNEKLIPDDSMEYGSIVELNRAYDALEDMLYAEDQEDLAEQIVRGISNLNNMFNNDELKTILLNILHELAKNGTNDFVFVKHEAARQFYEKYTEIVNNIDIAKKECQEREQIRETALGKLTAREREILGL